MAYVLRCDLTKKEVFALVRRYWKRHCSPDFSLPVSRDLAFDKCFNNSDPFSGSYSLDNLLTMENYNNLYFHIDFLVFSGRPLLSVRVSDLSSEPRYLGPWYLDESDICRFCQLREVL